MSDNSPVILDNDAQPQADLEPISTEKRKRPTMVPGFWVNDPQPQPRDFAEGDREDSDISKDDRRIDLQRGISLQKAAATQEKEGVAIFAVIIRHEDILGNRIDAAIARLPGEFQGLIDYAAKVVRKLFHNRHFFIFVVKQNADNDIVSRSYIEVSDENGQLLYSPRTTKQRINIELPEQGLARLGRDFIEAFDVSQDSGKEKIFQGVIEGTGHSDLLAVAAATPAAASDESATPPPPHPQHEETNKSCDSATDRGKTGGNNNDPPPRSAQRSTVSLAILRECRAAMDGLRTIFKDAHDSSDRQTADTLCQEVEALQQELTALLREFRIAGHPGGSTQPQPPPPPVATDPRAPQPEFAHGPPSPPLPDIPEKKWLTDRLKNETPPQFVVRIYGNWMRAGVLTRAYLQKDPPLYTALRKYLKKAKDQGLPLPEDFDLPSLHEASASRRERLGVTSADEALQRAMDAASSEVKELLLTYHSLRRSHLVHS